MSLLELRKAKKISQADLAKAVGVSQQAVSQWENGIQEPKLRYIRKLAVALGVSVDKLLDCFDRL